MQSSMILMDLRAARERAAGPRLREILDPFERMLERVIALAGDERAPGRTRSKAAVFLDRIESAHADLGARFFHPSFLLNSVGDAMARANLPSNAVLDFIQVGLYFYGLDQIERRWSHQAAIYSGIHADLLTEYVGRESVKRLLIVAQARFAEGRVFCLTWHYLNALRKAYWESCRVSQDALDVAIASEEIGEAAVLDVAPHGDASSDRVRLMLDIFAGALTRRQQWIYLAKNRVSLDDAGTAIEAVPADLLVAAGESFAADGGLGWTAIAARLGINEKTAKREYLRSLHILLRQSAQAVFGEGRIPSRYVRRILDQIRGIVEEKDLRIRSSTGRGLGSLVEKWQVALRFVLNHAKVSA